MWFCNSKMLVHVICPQVLAKNLQPDQAVPCPLLDIRWNRRLPYVIMPWISRFENVWMYSYQVMVRSITKYPTKI